MFCSSCEIIKPAYSTYELTFIIELLVLIKSKKETANSVILWRSLNGSEQVTHILPQIRPIK